MITSSWQRTHVKKRLILFVLIFSTILLFPASASADVGPKPSLEVIVINAPEREYYLDLLVDYNSNHLYSYITKEKVAYPELYGILKNYNVDGWRPALVTGTKVPLNGGLVGVKNGDNMVHKFSYLGVPDRFKTIIVTEDQQVIVSKEIINRKAFNSTVYLDFQTQEISESPFVWAYLKQFFLTCILTLVIEGLLLLLFRFSWKANWKPFLSVNILTQVLLTIVILRVMYTSGTLAAFLLYIPFEVVILIIETKLFSKYLAQHTKLRRKLFAITANIVSFLFGIITLAYYPFISFFK